MNAEEMFQFQLTDPRHADVAGHLLTLRRYGAASRRVVEMGTDDGSTALAFLLGKPERLDCFDLWRQREIGDIERWAKDLGVAFEMHVGDSREIDCPPCDLLYLDTDHRSSTLLIELRRHSPSVDKYILLHDTQTCGDSSCGETEAGYDTWNGPGLWKAISQFLREDSRWRLAWVKHECCGLACLMRH